MAGQGREGTTGEDQRRGGPGPGESRGHMACTHSWPGRRQRSPRGAFILCGTLPGRARAWAADGSPRAMLRARASWANSRPSCGASSAASRATSLLQSRSCASWLLTVTARGSARSCHSREAGQGSAVLVCGASHPLWLWGLHTAESVGGPGSHAGRWGHPHSATRPHRLRPAPPAPVHKDPRGAPAPSAWNTHLRGPGASCTPGAVGAGREEARSAKHVP